MLLLAKRDGVNAQLPKSEAKEAEVKPNAKVKGNDDKKNNHERCFLESQHNMDADWDKQRGVRGKKGLTGPECRPTGREEKEKRQELADWRSGLR